MHYTEIETISNLSASAINSKLEVEGKVLISVKITRPTPYNDGSFEEEFEYLIGKPMEIPLINE